MLNVKIVNKDVILFKAIDNNSNYSESGIIDRETGEPKTFEREDASFVMPTIIDMNEQAYKLSKEKGISYEDAFKQLGEKS